MELCEYREIVADAAAASAQEVGGGFAFIILLVVGLVMGQRASSATPGTLEQRRRTQDSTKF